LIADDSTAKFLMPGSLIVERWNQKC